MNKIKKSKVIFIDTESEEWKKENEKMMKNYPEIFEKIKKMGYLTFEDFSKIFNRYYLDRNSKKVIKEERIFQNWTEVDTEALIEIFKIRSEQKGNKNE